MQHIFRGPAKSEQFAVYKQTAGKKKRGLRPSPMERRRGHQHFHDQMKHKRAVGEKVTAIIDGKEVSWINTYDGSAPAAPAPAPAPAPVVAAAAVPAAEPVSKAVTSTDNTSTDSSSKAAPKVSVSKGDWARVAKFDAASKTAEGVTFLANNNFTPK